MDPDNYINVLHSITAVTLTVQIYVVYLINYKTPSNMGQYRYFLYLFAIFDFAFTATLDIGLVPRQVGSLFGSEMQGLVRYLSPNGQRFMIGFIVYLGAMMIMCQDYCLLYRFTVIWNKTAHRYFMMLPTKIGCLLAGNAIACLLCYLIYNSIMDEETNRQLIKLESIETQLDAPSNQFFIWFDIKSRNTVICFGSVFFGFLLSEGVSIVLVIIIMRILKEHSTSFTKNTYRLHRQFTLLLAVQLALPVVLILIPVVITLIMGLLGYVFGLLGTQIGYIIFSCYAFLNSFFTILFVTPYREDFRTKIKILHLDRIFLWFFRARTSNTVQVSNVSSLDNINLTNPQRRTPRQAFN